MRALSWPEQVVNRLRSVSNVRGREELLGELGRMGFADALACPRRCSPASVDHRGSH